MIEKYQNFHESENFPLEERIVFRILNNLSDRRGLNDIWDEIDEETQDEILTCWVQIVKEELTKEKQWQHS